MERPMEPSLFSRMVSQTAWICCFAIPSRLSLLIIVENWVPMFLPLGQQTGSVGVWRQSICFRLGTGASPLSVEMRHCLVAEIALLAIVQLWKMQVSLLIRHYYVPAHLPNRQ